MAQKEDPQILRFLKDLMEIQRRYANELKNSKTNRQEEVKELLEKYASREGNNAD